MTHPTPAPTAAASSPKPEQLFYDGHCGVCHWAVSFVAKRDPEGRLFRFAPLHGETFTALVPETLQKHLPDSLVLHTHDGSLLTRSSGALHIMQRLGGVWRLLGALLWLVPRPLRDFGYDRFAAIRHRLARRPDGTCPLVAPELRARFDP